MSDESSTSDPAYGDPFSVGQDRLVTALKALPWMAAHRVPVEPERRGDIVQTMTNLLNRLGAAIVVMEAINGTLDEPDEPELVMSVEYVIEVVENVTINRSQEAPAEDEEAPLGVTALQIMGQALLGLHGKPSGLLNPRHPMGLWQADKNALRRLPHKTLSVYQTSFHVGISLADLQ